MCELKIFESPQFGSVRTLTEDGMTLFCGSDVAKALGYKNPHKALADHCRWVTKREVPHPQSAKKKIEMLFIPEGDIYRLAAKSELPGAEEFERWIFDEVLPTIRLTGGYTVRAMAEDLDVTTVTFLGTSLLAARDMDGQIWVGVRWMCDGIGLTEGQRNNQIRRIQKDKVLAQGAKFFRLPTSGGPQPVLCLKLDFTTLWLASVKITPGMQKEQPAAASRLVEYQLKMRDAVAAAMLDSGKIPLMQALVRMEQHQRSQDYAMQDMAYRLSKLECPVPLAPLAPPKPGPDESRSRPATDHLWQTRCHGILYRASKKAKKPQSQLELECCWRAANRSGERLEPGVRMMDEVAVNAVLRDAFIREVNELAEMYGV